MTKSITAVGFDLDQKQSDMIEKKLQRISYADDLIIDLIVRVKHEKEYSFDIVANFRWGVQGHTVQPKSAVVAVNDTSGSVTFGVFGSICASLWQAVEPSKRAAAKSNIKMCLFFIFLVCFYFISFSNNNPIQSLLQRS